jgi:rhodanese-related sulfurtransferase
MTEDQYILPEVGPLDLAGWMKDKPGIVVLDVREADETTYAPFPGENVVTAPLSMLSRLLERGLPPEVTPDTEVVVVCHLGERSAQVTYWLIVHLGFAKVFNLRGGIDAYARQVDPTVRRY